ncbi:MAG: hypothetical protein M3Z10_08580, partial [Gemmatimonadota bacterium]|nr:hypothetical protein [Gemmatimonadota bacterium]
MPTGTYAGLGLGLLIAVGGAVMAMLLAPGAKQNLGAASPSRLQLERSSVRPGAAVGMRYRPAPALADRQNVTVWAWYRRRDGAQ